jgi:hypothetical protein
VKKIPTVFLRNFDPPWNGRYVTTTPNPACTWVLAGEGVATHKLDGTCVMFDGSEWWARREVKPGKTPPPGWRAIEFDDTTGKAVGWEPIELSAFAKFHAEALEYAGAAWPVGTYELIGPKINGNRERVTRHELRAHAAAAVMVTALGGPRTYESIRAAVLSWGDLGVEGFVYHHKDGRMAKIKAKDFPPADPR